MHSALLFLASVHCVSIYLSLLSDDFEREFDSRAIEFSRQDFARARPRRLHPSTGADTA